EDLSRVAEVASHEGVSSHCHRGNHWQAPQGRLDGALCVADDVIRVSVLRKFDTRPACWVHHVAGCWQQWQFSLQHCKAQAIQRGFSLDSERSRIWGGLGVEAK